MQSVAIIDYGMGNLRSVAKAVEYVAPNTKVWISNQSEYILAADRVIFPGVGAIRDCVNALNKQELISVIRKCTKDRPFLGICLGMQALLDFSEENAGTYGLGILPGRVLRFPNTGDTQRLKIPHMGWNQVQPSGIHPLWQGINPESRFYFVHSYYVVPDDPQIIQATTNYGVNFACALGKENLFAVQFHPEKSQRAGLTLLANFMNWDGSL